MRLTSTRERPHYMFQYMFVCVNPVKTGFDLHHLSEECSGTSLLLRKAGLQMYSLQPGGRRFDPGWLH